MFVNFDFKWLKKKVPPSLLYAASLVVQNHKRAHCDYLSSVKDDYNCSLPIKMKNIS